MRAFLIAIALAATKPLPTTAPARAPAFAPAISPIGAPIEAPTADEAAIVPMAAALAPEVKRKGETTC